MDQVVCFLCFLSFLKQVNEEDKNVTPIFKRASEATEGLRTLLRITDYHLCRAVRPLSHRVQMSAAPWPLFYGASSAAVGFGAVKKFSKGYMQQTLRHWTNLKVRVCVLGIRLGSKQSSAWWQVLKPLQDIDFFFLICEKRRIPGVGCQRRSNVGYDSTTAHVGGRALAMSLNRFHQLANETWFAVHVQQTPERSSEPLQQLFHCWECIKHPE